MCVECINLHEKSGAADNVAEDAIINGSSQPRICFNCVDLGAAAGDGEGALVSPLETNPDAAVMQYPVDTDNELITAVNPTWPYIIQVMVHIAVVQKKLISWKDFSQRVLDDLGSQTSVSLNYKIHIIRRLLTSDHFAVVPSARIKLPEDEAKVERTGIVLKGKLESDEEPNASQKRGGTLRVVFDKPEFVLGTERRFHQQFGAARFLHVPIKKNDGDSFKAESIEVLVRQPFFELLGRRWELLVPRTKERMFELIFFAVSGEGLPTVPVQQVREWHLPIANSSQNQEMTVAKYISRFDLGFSECFRTVNVCTEGQATNDEEQNIGLSFEDDVMNTDGTLEMTDGCGGAEPAIMDRIAGYLRTHHPQVFKKTDDAENISCFQFRLGPIKGLIYRDDAVKGIQVRDSMNKYDLLKRPTRAEATPTQMCIEINSSSRRQHTPINRQCLRLLEARGVPDATFIELYNEDHEDRLHATDDRDKLQRLLGLSTSPYAQEIKDYYNAGFKPDNPIVASLINKLGKSKDRFEGDGGHESKIRLRQSRRCYIIADPTGTLKPNECYANLSGRGIVIQDVALIRNPCYHPGEILKLKAVATTEKRLSNLHNVVVLSSVGKRSIADMMQGGDYDGDAVIIVWDERIVGAMRGPGHSGYCPGIDDPPVYEDVPKDPNFVGNKPVGADYAALSTHVQQTFAKNFANGTQLGKLSNLHECWADIAAGNWASVAGRKAMRCAQLAFHVMDAPKTGIHLQIPSELENVPLPDYNVDPRNPSHRARQARPSKSVVAHLVRHEEQKMKEFSQKELGKVPAMENLSHERRQDVTEEITRRRKELAKAMEGLIELANQGGW